MAHDDFDYWFLMALGLVLVYGLIVGITVFLSNRD